MDPQNFVAKLQQHMAELKPLKSPSNRKQNIFVHKDLKSCSHVFLRIDRVKKALEPPYEGPYTVHKKYDKYFTILIKDKTINISVDRLKPAYLLAVDNQNEQTSVGQKNEISNWKELSPMPDEQSTTSCGRKIKNQINLAILLIPRFADSETADRCSYLEDAEIYREKLWELTTKIELKSKECTVPSDKESRKFKLSKIELKRFNGEAKEYLTFWSQFQKLHKDRGLLQSMEPGLKAERLVLSFPATAANYPKAIDQPKERFGREDLLVQIYVRDILTLFMKNAATERAKADLLLLYDELESKLRSLESLGKTQDKYGDFLTPLE
ncbi:uncharacterized protein TNCV_3028962 [Trichonephila clavipes]|nr:uncharacterized protein TNCV_3028962 [Trichonephila clavipes]